MPDDDAAILPAGRCRSLGADGYGLILIYIISGSLDKRLRLRDGLRGVTWLIEMPRLRLRPPSYRRRRRDSGLSLGRASFHVKSEFRWRRLESLTAFALGDSYCDGTVGFAASFSLTHLSRFDVRRQEPPPKNEMH